LIDQWGGIILDNHNVKPSKNVKISSSDLTELSAYNEPPNTRIVVKKYYESAYFLTSDWIGAFNFCKINGMELVNFRNQAEAEELLEMFELKAKFGFAFIDGITNSIGSGDWRHFVNGKRFPDNFPWGPGQPNNGQGGQHCVFISKISYKGFYDAPCSVATAYVCQDIVGV
jgi:Lectin C-type domain